MGEGEIAGIEKVGHNRQVVVAVEVCTVDSGSGFHDSFGLALADMDPLEM